MMAQRSGQGPGSGQREAPSAEQRAERMSKHVSSDLELSDDKSEKLEGIMLSFTENMEEARKAKDQGAMSALEERRDEEVKMLLENDDQYTRYLAIMAEAKNKRPQRGGGRASE